MQILLIISKMRDCIDYYVNFNICFLGH